MHCFFGKLFTDFTTFIVGQLLASVYSFYSILLIGVQCFFLSFNDPAYIAKVVNLVICITNAFNLLDYCHSFYRTRTSPDN